MELNKIIQGDCLEVLKTLEADSIDLVCTDPPYGIGFMGKEWDTFKPDVVEKGVEKSSRKDEKLIKIQQDRNSRYGVTFKKGSPSMEAARYDHSNTGAKKFREWFTEISVELVRVLKPGAFAFVCIGARQDSVSAAITAMTEAGFKTDFTSLFWAYASGFPKASNISKMVDKRLGKERKRFKNDSKIAFSNIGPAGYRQERYSDEAKTLQGSYGGFQPKPAVEVIIVAMKPISEKTYVDQALKNGKGITWLDDVGIPAERDLQNHSRSAEAAISKGKYGDSSSQETHQTTMQREGKRFPANLLISDDVLNDGRIQKSGTAVKHNSVGQNFGGGKKPTSDDIGYPDSGSYSRYFSLDAWAKTLPFLIVPKASKSEKNKGLENQEEETVGDGRAVAIDNAFQRGKTARKNIHPTVKPLKLMSYLITLGSRPGDVILDPFLGSGTTAVAAKELGRNYIGIEREADYIKISEARIKTVADRLL